MPRQRGSRRCWPVAASRPWGCASACGRAAARGSATRSNTPTRRAKFDEIVEDKGVTILVDPKAVMFILGTEMDYVEEKLQTGFVFRNPNEKGRCGCGESFHV